jgi:hypothetical protein
VHLDLVPVRADQLLEGGLVTRSGPVDQLDAYGSILAAPRSPGVRACGGTDTG